MEGFNYPARQVLFEYDGFGLEAAVRCGSKPVQASFWPRASSASKTVMHSSQLTFPIPIRLKDRTSTASTLAHLELLL